MVKRNNRIISLSLIYIVVCLLTSCTNGEMVDANQLQIQDILNAAYIIPDHGVEKLKAVSIVSNYLKDEVHIKGDFSESIEFNEITTQELWDNNSIQLFRVEINYAWFDGVAIFKNGEFLGMLIGQNIIRVLIDDLDRDGKYDICLNSDFGSGIVNRYIQVFNIEKRNTYTLNMREQEMDIMIEVNEPIDGIDVYYKDIYSDIDTKVYGGRLSIRNGTLEVIKK